MHSLSRSILLVFFCVCAHAREPVVAREFMVSTAHPLAAQAGYDVLARGGSAVDAAIAVQMVLVWARRHFAPTL